MEREKNGMSKRTDKTFLRPAKVKRNIHMKLSLSTFLPLPFPLSSPLYSFVSSFNCQILNLLDQLQILSLLSLSLSLSLSINVFFQGLPSVQLKPIWPFLFAFICKYTTGSVETGINLTLSCFSLIIVFMHIFSKQTILK